MSEAKSILEICDLSVKLSNGVTALDGINIDVKQKDLIALIGPNGAGKSTLLKVILGQSNQQVAQSNYLGLKT